MKLPHKPTNQNTSGWVEEEIEDWIYRIMLHDRPHPYQQNKSH